MTERLSEREREQERKKAERKRERETVCMNHRYTNNTKLNCAWSAAHAKLFIHAHPKLISKNTAPNLELFLTRDGL